jgi:addiction module HigA family antidote
MATRLPPVHPGEVPLEEFLAPLGLASFGSPRTLMFRLAGSTRSCTGRAVSVHTALRLARYLGTSERFWLNLQAQYDLDMEYDRVGDRIDKEIEPRAV